MVIFIKLADDNYNDKEKKKIIEVQIGDVITSHSDLATHTLEVGAPSIGTSSFNSSSFKKCWLRSRWHLKISSKYHPYF